MLSARFIYDRMLLYYKYSKRVLTAYFMSFISRAFSTASMALFTPSFA